MKFFFTFFLFAFLAGGTCFSQNTSPSVIYLNKLSAAGILLDTGWKFQAGDNPGYAKPGFDDNKWKSINPAVDILRLPQVHHGIIWFRLHMFLDSSVRKKQLSLFIEQSGASEIYFNGNLIHAFGVLDTVQRKVKAYDPVGAPFPLPVANDGQQVLAIRYAVQPGINYKTIFSSHNYVEHITIHYTENANRLYRLVLLIVFGSSFSLLGVFFILAVLHFSFFLFYRSKKANLYFGFFALLTTGGFIMNVISFNIHWVEDKFRFFYLGACFMQTGVLFLLASIYQHLGQKMGVWFSILVAIGMVIIVCIALPGYWGWEISAGYTVYIINLDIARISFMAVKKKQRGARIMAIGSACFVASWIIFATAGNPGSIDLLTVISFDTAFLWIPIATSVYLGLDFAYTNRLLQVKLTEVNELSEKTIAQEREKQQILSSQKETLEQQVSQRTAQLKQSIENLKSTQAQLIQSEKMASLGELTAGIAHEIQNPLNFVNNFAEVSNEMIDEMKQQLATGHMQQANEIADDLKQNLDKINQHGKRADAIVKGMLQHSRISSGQKELTDVNALCDEYLRLAYHGLRAKDKSFNVKIETDFDPSIGKIDIVPRDIGRVILNLINNAFYAVGEKARLRAASYEPRVVVATKKLDGKVEITVTDNGDGIPKTITGKIFQPFFTTKPTGQGTGLGLSLAYDIVKAHGGEIKVETNEGEGSEFAIQLPSS
jgi:two-component system, NtrC family, sensor kinase